MSDIKRKSDLETSHAKGQLRKDPFFGEFFVYNSLQGGSQIICVEKLFNDKESVLREVDAKKKKILNKHQNILNLLDYSVEVQSNWCSTFYLLKLFFEWPEKSLKQEILDRKGLSGNAGAFSMKETTALLYNIVHACAFLQEKNVYHGDISPMTIFLAGKPEFKLAFRVSEQLTSERVQIDKSIKNEPLYLAPSVFAAVKNRTLERSRHNPFKADIFSLGLSLLETGLMRSIQAIYGLNDTFDTNALEDLLAEFENRYEDNPLLFTSVRKMVEINEEERPDFTSLKSALPEYEVIQDYFYRLENGLIEDEGQDDSGGLNNSFNQQNRESGQQEHQRYSPPYDQQRGYNSAFQHSDSLTPGEAFGYNFYDEPAPSPLPVPHTNFDFNHQQGQRQGFPAQPNGQFGSHSQQNSQNNSFNVRNSSSDHSWNPPLSPNVPAQQQQPFAFQQSPKVRAEVPYEQVRSSQKPANYESDFFNTDFTTDFSINPSHHTDTYPSSFQQPPQQSIDIYGRSVAPSPQPNQYTQPKPQPLQPTNPYGQQLLHNAPEQTNSVYHQPSNQYGYGGQQQKNYQPQTQQAFFPPPQTAPQHQAYAAPSQQQAYSAPPVNGRSPAPQAYQNPQTQGISQFAPPQAPNPASGPVPTGNTKIINNQLYNEVREEITEPGPSGALTRKIIIKYVPANTLPPQAPAPSQTYNGSHQPRYGQAHGYNNDPFFV